MMSSHTVKPHLLDHLRHFFLQCGLTKTYWIGYSGGLDSHVLLSLCHALRTELSLNFYVLHVNHGLSPLAAAWSAHCARVADDYAIPYVERTIQINVVNRSLEEVARQARYDVFAEYIDDNAVLLTAHQEDDQAETVLLQLLRGAGPKGLAAMPTLKTFSRGWQGRPLLTFKRTTLLQYANEAQLRWIDDESNADESFARNYLRHTILPLIEKRWPSASLTLARSAMHCAQAETLLEEFADSLLVDMRGAHANGLSVTKLLTLSTAKQQLVLRTWIDKSGHPFPDTKKLQAIQHDVLTAAQDRFPMVTWRDTILRRYRDELFIMKPQAFHDASLVYSWDRMQPCLIPGIGELRAMKSHGGLRLNIPEMTVRFRQGGETLYLGKRGRHTLKNLFNEWSVPPWQRDRIPLIFIDKKLIGVVGYAFDPDYQVNGNEEGFMINIDIA